MAEHPTVEIVLSRAGKAISVSFGDVTTLFSRTDNSVAQFFRDAIPPNSNEIKISGDKTVPAELWPSIVNDLSVVSPRLTKLEWTNRTDTGFNDMCEFVLHPMMNMNSATTPVSVAVNGSQLIASFKKSDGTPFVFHFIVATHKRRRDAESLIKAFGTFCYLCNVEEMRLDSESFPRGKYYSWCHTLLVQGLTIENKGRKRNADNELRTLPSFRGLRKLSLTNLILGEEQFKEICGVLAHHNTKLESLEIAGRSLVGHCPKKKDRFGAFFDLLKHNKTITHLKIGEWGGNPRRSIASTFDVLLSTLENDNFTLRSLSLGGNWKWPSKRAEDRFKAVLIRNRYKLAHLPVANPGPAFLNGVAVLQREISDNQIYLSAFYRSLVSCPYIVKK